MEERSRRKEKDQSEEDEEVCSSTGGCHWGFGFHGTRSHLEGKGRRGPKKVEEEEGTKASEGREEGGF